MLSAAPRPKSQCRACLIEGRAAGVPDRAHPTSPTSGEYLPSPGHGDEWEGERCPRSTPSQLVTCIISGALVEGRPNAIAALRRILEHSASQILPNGGMVSGPSGPLMIQGPPLPTLPRKRGGVGRGLRLHRLNRGTVRPRHHGACVRER